jgi:hypothetical protein
VNSLAVHRSASRHPNPDFTTSSGSSTWSGVTATVGTISKRGGERMARAGLMEGDLHRLQLQEIDDNLLFHYTPPTSLEAILKNWTLRLGAYANTNDPREQKEWRAGFVIPTAGGRPPEQYLRFARESGDEVDQATDRLLRRGARLACFAVDRVPLPDAAAGCLFHRGWARARMWQQYAKKHTGACLAFDRTGLLEAIDEQLLHHDGDLFFWGRVEYQDQPLTIPLRVPDLVDIGIEKALDDLQTRKGTAQHLYMTKNTDWESEQEFRIVVVRWNVPKSEANVPIKIDFRGCLKAIVLGEHFAGDIATLLGTRTGVDVLRCWWGDGVPLLADGPV